MDTKAKHTAGPWRANREVHRSTGIPQPYWEIYTDPSLGLTGYIAQVDGMRDECQEANARLIAAAPELLEACKYALRFLNPKDHDVEFVKSAISKATEVR